MISNDDILFFLKGNKDTKYMEFSSKLIPNSSNIIGVRLPILRTFAKRIAKENDVKKYIKNAKNDYFEELILQGFVIGYCNLNIDDVLELCNIFIPKITNWSVCDSFCNTLKIAKKYPEKVWDYILTYAKSNREFEIRFFAIMCLNYYINEKYINKIFEIIDKIDEVGYYDMMGIAWLLATCYTEYKEITLTYLKNCKISDLCYKKVVQKICESYKVSNHDKEVIKKMKR